MNNQANAVNFKELDQLFAGLDISKSNQSTNSANGKNNSVEVVTENNVVGSTAQSNSNNNVANALNNNVGKDNISIFEPSSELQSAQVKMQAISAEMNNSFVEREELIKLMQLAVCTNTNLLMLGPPGTGKSMITQEICSRITNANYFQWLLNKTSDPSEILGSYSVKEMENDKFVRVTNGKLPEAHIAFIDEVFKSNAPTLNTLLTIMNEHIFYNDGKAVPVPLISMFGASNEMPEDESLDAMYDRFILRANVEYVHDPSNKKRMIGGYLSKRAGVDNLSGKTTISLNEIKALQKATLTVNVSKDIINKFIRLISALDKQAIYVSDRRQNECFKIMQGNAVLSGRNSVMIDDFKPLIYVLWQKPEQYSIIESEILKLINPYDDKFNEIMKNFTQIETDINNTNNPQEKTKKAIESKNAIEKLIAKLNKLMNEAVKNGRDITKFNEFRENMLNYNQKLISEALGTTFDINNMVTQQNNINGDFASTTDTF